MQIELENILFALPALAVSNGGGFAFALHKGGSVLFNSAIARLTRGSATDYFSLPNFLFSRGISVNSVEFSPSQKETLFKYFDKPGVIFGGWRIYPENIDLPIRASTKTFLLLRDPRDILTSYYFHMKSSARAEGPRAEALIAFRTGPAIGIDEYVLSQAREFLRRYTSYQTLGAISDLKLCRYEDVIFDKVSLLKNVCDHFGIDQAPKKISRLAEDLNKIPKRENEHSHVRQVAPGDHKRKLKPSTIEQLDDIMAPILTRYGYA